MIMLKHFCSTLPPSQAKSDGLKKKKTAFNALRTSGDDNMISHFVEKPHMAGRYHEETFTLNRAWHTWVEFFAIILILFFIFFFNLAYSMYRLCKLRRIERQASCSEEKRKHWDFRIIWFPINRYRVCSFRAPNKCRHAVHFISISLQICIQH